MPSVPVTDWVPTAEQRNREIYDRYLQGARAVDLADEYDVSLNRIYILIRRYRGRE